MPYLSVHTFYLDPLWQNLCILKFVGVKNKTPRHIAIPNLHLNLGNVGLFFVKL